MKLIDMKRPKLSEAEMKQTAPVSPGENRWPYGLKLNFDPEDTGKIPSLENVKIGEKVTIEGLGEVVDISKSDTGTTIGIQIQQIGVSSKESFDESFDEAAKQSGDTWSRFHEKALREEASTKIV